MSETANAGAALAPGCIGLLEAMSGMGHVPSTFMLKMGRAWTPQPRPAAVARGAQRQCYRNAGTLALEDRSLTYVEGYAQPPNQMPVHHAWCVDADGRVIDNTFDDCEQAEYYGVPLSRDALYELVEKVKCWGLFAEMMSAETLLRAVDDIQAGPYAVEASEADTVRALIKQHA